MVSQKVYDLCRSDVTVSSELARDPTQSPASVVKRLYGDSAISIATENPFHNRKPVTEEDLQRAFECGKWGSTRPSELFLRAGYPIEMCRECSLTLSIRSFTTFSVRSNMIPWLDSGVIPLSIVAPLPDICRHMSNVIARAQREVFLATNYWQASDASLLITNSLRELSRRAGERGQKVIVKIMYDRGNAKQVLDNHQPVSPAEYVGKNVQLPPPEELPNIDMQVVNYHRPIFGTFHSKYMVVDRKIAILSSNNIQDNDNFEMMSHLEGPIVDSFYDMSLISWHNALDPPLPSHNTPAAVGGLPSFGEASFKELFDQNGLLRDHLRRAPQNNPTQGLEGTTIPGLSERAYPTAQTENKDARSLGEVAADGRQQQLPEHTEKDPHYDLDIASEVTRAVSVLQPRGDETKMNAVTRHLNTTIQKDTKGSAPECAQDDEMTPLIPHPVHEPFPIAMVCRKPWGAPNHSSVHVPQNEAWLSAIRNAKEKVFIQTPDLNAEPLLPELLAAVRRGVEVTYYVCLGYNDSGELLPFQGGHNEMIANKLLKALNEEEKQRLNIYNYVAKDQDHPIHNKFKKRSCHIKLMIVDGHIGIQGNGNQDTQSWYHSQEVNVLIDSMTICAAWTEAIRRNQNTGLYGAVDREQAVWLDSNGKQADGAIGVDPGKFSWAKGVVGAVQRVRGAGGF
ncbi:MAG: hypothetical protein M1819_004425 [Sarea resinae]|nr:MAG: hypothetical protein M1819_004425 [Sarea resinae]